VKNQKSLFVMCFIVTALLASCGSSSKSTGATTNGVFADAPVVGVTYACGTQKGGGTQTGVTGTGGTFTCPAASSVTFSVGGITLCTATAQAFMTPVSCAQATDPSASAATASVIAVTRFLMSISTTPASSGTLTITAAELQAAAGLTLDFSNATDAQLLTAVQAVSSPTATLVDATTAENEITGTVNAASAGNYAGTYSGSSSGTWTVTIASNGSVSGTGTDSKGGTSTVSGNLVSGTIYSGTAGSATWTGTLDTSKTPAVFSGTWNNSPDTGTFTGTKK
jgi:hypothetical protein